jgi:hypothetical protein
MRMLARPSAVRHSPVGCGSAAAAGKIPFSDNAAAQINERMLNADRLNPDKTAVDALGRGIGPRDVHADTASRKHKLPVTILSSHLQQTEALSIFPAVFRRPADPGGRRRTP